MGNIKLESREGDVRVTLRRFLGEKGGEERNWPGSCQMAGFTTISVETSCSAPAVLGCGKNDT